ncbi:MAG: glutamine synthetase III [Candidatus Aenigmarchaeota archaeon]|nr:glutamine synthetase III [Candidatus Aenigmarchaeota archaeon]
MAADNAGKTEITETYGENSFGLNAMSAYLPTPAFTALKNTLDRGDPFPEELLGDVAEGMKNWAISKGATHFTHWFQPMTGLTAEKHEAFLEPLSDGRAIMKFSAKNLVSGEPDASSFPSGGLRATFEARGHTTWDPTSPAFIKYIGESPTLCIPSAFYSYNGDALDKKTPLLRSAEALSKSTRRLLKLFGEELPDKKAVPMVGIEQEYFLIDRDFYLERPDIILTGRSLFGRIGSKHQQMEDHYFGSIRKRVICFMEEVDKECWKLGIPAKMRHNEVAPAQFEIVPLYEEQNLAVDHNMLIMQILKETAEKHGLVCLLHEKPFKGVNGSGKHNNWSLFGPDGKNLLDPGHNPQENAKFLTAICAVIMAVDKHADLLRASVASSGNDHRLGANEAPPAIISISLGDELTEIISRIESGRNGTGKPKEMLKIGVSSIPPIPKDTTDRNRTSPFAFTGNKFEFRAVGSSQSCAGANTVLNTIIAEALDEICSQAEALTKKGEIFNQALQKVLLETIRKHKRIIFNGDNYSPEWQEEAKRRGLLNIRATPEALEYLRSEKAQKLFEKYGVYSKRELESRYHILWEMYEKTIDLEGKCMLDLAKTMILPAALRHQRNLCREVLLLKEANKNAKSISGMEKRLNRVSNLISKAMHESENLERIIEAGKTSEVLNVMANLREAIDGLEGEVEDKLWPVPKFREMLFVY